MAVTFTNTEKNTMKNQSARLAVIVCVAGLLLSGDLLLAQSSSKKMEPATTQQKAKMSADGTQVAKDGYAAVRAMHAARVAIFNGEPDTAKKALADAKSLLEKAKADENAAGMQGGMIPIDGSLALGDTFVTTPECATCIAKANEHFTAGNKSEGFDELRLGKIEVNFSRVLMPIEATEKQLTKAIDFANNGKYYECNLALKAAEDGLELDSVSLIEFPEAGDAAKASKAGEMTGQGSKKMDGSSSK